MYVINLDEKKWYEFGGEKYAEDIINDMFKAYFQRTYRESTVKSLLKDMWENIEIKIPKQVIFLWKDKILYYIAEAENKNETENEYEGEDEYEDEDEDRFMRFEIAPRCLFKIKKDTHKVLKECFEECNEKFVRIIQNVTSETGWESTSFTMMNLRYEKDWRDIKWKCEDLKETLRNKQQNFESFVGKSLKEELCKEVVSKMLKQYRKILLDSNPIMFITNANTEEIYAIDNELVTKRVSFFSIQEDLESIISEILPSDYEFLVNRIYNYITFPKEKIPAQIRIKKVTENGLIGFIYGKKETFPIVRSVNGEYFTIITIKPNENNWSAKERLCFSYDYDISIKSTICNYIIGEIDKSILPVYGYIEKVGEIYKINDMYSGEDLELNRVYILENGEIYDVFDCTKDSVISESEGKKIKKFYRGEKNKLHYAFFEVIFKS